MAPDVNHNFYNDYKFNYSYSEGRLNAKLLLRNIVTKNLADLIGGTARTSKQTCRGLNYSNFNGSAGKLLTCDSDPKKVYI